MINNEQWRIALAEVLRECFEAIDSGNPFDADSWICLEERLGTKVVRDLWASKPFGQIAKGLDFYCSAVSHDRAIVFGDLKCTEVRRILHESLEQLDSGGDAFPSELLLFE